MSVFEFEGDSQEREVTAVKSVDVQVSNNNGYEQYRATIPREFADEMSLERGDTLIMERRDDGIFIHEV